jgi:cell division protein ZapE
MITMAVMSPITYYKNQIQKGLIAEDAQQLQVLQYLEKVAANLGEEEKSREKPFAIFRKAKLVHGLYLWGGVGIGKTFVMDCFYHSLPFTQKLRIHFHKFMKMIHHELKQNQGKKNPLQIIAHKIAKQHIAICFDEFVVTDIADAMILARLIKALFAEGVTLVATSNIAPDDLYKHGLQRSLFLPAIALIKKHTEVMHVQTQMDYRLRHLEHAGVFYTPLDETADENMRKSFEILKEDSQEFTEPVIVCHREIPIIKRTNNIIWFDFKVICHVPRSQHDYLEIAEKYQTIFISNITSISPNDRNTINLFIRMIDVFYDARRRLVCSSEETIENIYKSGPLKFEYTRTCSRLIEMQSESYFNS